MDFLTRLNDIDRSAGAGPAHSDVPAVRAPPQARQALDPVLFDLGVEPAMTVNEAAAVLRWSYWKTRRYFRQVEGICVSYQPKRYKRPYRTFTIPLSVFAREWQRMTGREPQTTEILQRRIAVAVQKSGVATRLSEAATP